MRLSIIRHGESENDDESTITVITHGGMIVQLYRAFLKLPIDSNVVFATGDTGIHEWLIGDERFILRANIQEHLK